MKKPFPLLWRRLSQLLFLTIFLVLFVRTDYQGQDELFGAVNLIFRIDPLVALAATLATRTFIALLLPAVFVLLASLLLGRWFCGWVCPLGTLLDGSKPLFPRRNTPLPDTLPRLRYILLLLILFGALFGLPLVGFFDPLAILVRGLTMAVYPAFALATEALFTLTYQHGPDWLNQLTEPLYQFLRWSVLPFQQKFFTLVLPAAAMLLTVFLLEFWQRRFFCRNLCPLGALLGLAARMAPWRVANQKPTCNDCSRCSTLCRTGAIDQNSQVNPERCVLCLDCISLCSRQNFTFGRAPKKSFPLAEGLSRRTFVGTVLAAMATPFLLGVRSIKQRPEPGLIRPPGALAEKQFLDRCVRCGECMQVCIGNALHPTLVEAGIEGLFSPRVIPRIGYCEYQCTLCGQVCPTGAIKNLSVSGKKTVIIGLAYIDRNRCLPFAKGVPCLVCEEHCPTPKKAIQLHRETVLNDQGQRVTIQLPHVVEDLCIGCGICENKCPLHGRSAILVTAAAESRHQGSFSNQQGYG